GYQNSALGNNSVIAGGALNLARGDNTAIAGGWLITNLTGNTFIGGGELNLAEAFARYSVIGGGAANTIHSNSPYSVIMGGNSNVLGSNAAFAVIAGGNANLALGTNSFVAGHRAKAAHQGSFVWADATEADFASTVSNQFNLRANGGIRMETAGAGATLDGQQILRGIVPGSGLSGSYSSPVAFNNGADLFAGAFTG